MKLQGGSDWCMLSDLFLLGPEFCTSVFKFSCPMLLMQPRGFLKGFGVWAGQLFSHPVFPLAERKVIGCQGL